jgi:hypothetical protein
MSKEKSRRIMVMRNENKEERAGIHPIIPILLNDINEF